MKILVYKLYLCDGEEKTNFQIEKILDFINTGNPSQRFQELSNGSFTMNKFRDSNLGGPESNRSFWISKYRNKKPLLGTKRTDDADEIDRDVIEPATCLVIPRSNLLIMEYSHLGCRRKSLEEYLNRFIRTEQQKYNIKVIPVQGEDSLTLIEEADRINAVEIEFYTDGINVDNLINNREDVSILTTIKSATKSSIESAEQLGGNIAKVSLRKKAFGNRKDEALNFTVLSQILNNMALEDDNLISFKVEIKKGKKKRIIDMKHAGYLQFDISTDGISNGFDYLTDLLVRHCYEQNNENWRFNSVATDLMINTDKEVNQLIGFQSELGDGNSNE